MKIFNLLSSRLLLLLLLIIAGFLGRQEYVQYKNQKAIETEKEKITDQIQSLSQKNKELSQSLSYLNSQNSKERIAREQLNLKKEGEEMFSFSQTNLTVQTDTAKPVAKSNPEKWLQYFFNTR